MKIGVFSGTFDPVHDGHVWLAKKSIEMGLDKVVFIPEGVPRRKNNVTDLDKRVEMLKIVVKNNERYELLVAEKERSHTVIGVLNALNERFGEGNKYTIILGADVFEYLARWPDSEKLVKEVDFIVALRTEDDGELVVEVAGEFNVKPNMVVSEFTNLSSSKIRKTISKSAEPTGVDAKVLQYIKANKLYA